MDTARFTLPNASRAPPLGTRRVHRQTNLVGHDDTVPRPASQCGAQCVRIPVHISVRIPPALEVEPGCHPRAERVHQNGATERSKEAWEVVAGVDRGPCWVATGPMYCHSVLQLGVATGVHGGHVRDRATALLSGDPLCQLRLSRAGASEDQRDHGREGGRSHTEFGSLS